VIYRPATFQSLDARVTRADTLVCLDRTARRAGAAPCSRTGAAPPTFSTTEKSVANDIAILNFALILEYLEPAFYRINAATYYPS
jgi:hypothetical protein